MKRKTAFVCYGFMAGLFAASFLNVRAVGAAVLLSALAAVCGQFLFTSPAVRAAVTAMSCALCAAFAVNFVYTVSVYERALALDGQTVSVTATVTDFTDIGADKFLITLRAKTDDGVSLNLNVFAPAADCDYYDRVRMTVKLEKLTDSVIFPSESYNKPKGIFLQGAAIGTPVYTKQPALRPLAAVRDYGDYLFGKITGALTGDTGGFLGAMLVGDKSALSASAKLSLYRAGIGHIFSVSGAHLVIASGFVLFLLRALRLRRGVQVAATEAFVLAFCVFAGLCVPVLRAGVMMTVLNLSVLVRRKSDPATLIGATGVALTLFSPYAIRDASFLLSMGGVFAMSVTAPFVTKLLLSKKPRLRKALAPLLTMVVITVSSLPLTVLFFDELSVVSPAANLLLMPLCTAALVPAIVVALTGGAAFVAAPLLVFSGLCVKAVLAISAALNAIPYSFVPVGTFAVKLAAVLVTAGFVLAVLLFRRGKPALITAMCGVFIVTSAGMLHTSITAKTYYAAVLSDGASCAIVFYQAKEAVILDLNGGGDIAAACKRILSGQGITQLDAVLVQNHVQNKLAVYDALPVKAAAFNPPLPFDNGFVRISGGENGAYTIEINGAIIHISEQPGDISDGSAWVSYGGTAVAAAGGAAYTLSAENGAFLFTVTENGIGARRIGNGLVY
ncbi:MAG: ComEC/Rec2 family competence protein [Oscillospiraceae bacterium]